MNDVWAHNTASMCFENFLFVVGNGQFCLKCCCTCVFAVSGWVTNVKLVWQRASGQEFRKRHLKSISSSL